MRYADILYLQQLEVVKQMAADRDRVRKAFEQIAQRERELLEAVETRLKTADGVEYTEVATRELSFLCGEDEGDDDGRYE